MPTEGVVVLDRENKSSCVASLYKLVLDLIVCLTKERRSYE